MMKSKVTFGIAWDIDEDKKSGYFVRRISCGDTEDIPLEIYMAVLKAMLQVEDILNGKDAAQGDEDDQVVDIQEKKWGKVEPPKLPPPPRRKQ